MEALGFLSGENAFGLSFTGQDANLYAYVRNNPLLYNDPQGALIQFGPAVAKVLRAAALAIRFFFVNETSGAIKPPKALKPKTPEQPVSTKPIDPPKPPKQPSCL